MWAKVSALETKEKALEDKVMDLESRPSRKNLRLVSLPEGPEGHKPCLFLEKWLPEALNITALKTPLIIERVHQIGPPPTLIMQFLN